MSGILIMTRVYILTPFVCRPDTERYSHYFEAHLAKQLDSVIHFDETKAPTALEAVSEHAEDDLPETYPSRFRH